MHSGETWKPECPGGGGKILGREVQHKLEKWSQSDLTWLKKWGQLDLKCEE